jgi:hypothetical protein
MRSPRTSILFWRAAILAAGCLQAPCGVRAEGVERAGPWAFTERLNESTRGLEQMAVTPAAEDSDIWLLLACSQSRFTASLMHNAQFPYAVGTKSALSLRTDVIPTISIEAESTQQNQLSISAAMSRHLMPLFLNSKTLVISFKQGTSERHDYTFSLQPNGRSLAGIVRGCWTGD